MGWGEITHPALADALGASRVIGVPRLVRERDELLALVREIAPADRSRAWHYEECVYDLEEAQSSRVWLNARNQTEADRGPCPPGWTDRDVTDAEREAMRDAYDSWQRHLKWHIADLVQYLHTPTDEELCEDGCVYPAARRLLESIEAVDHG